MSARELELKAVVGDPEKLGSRLASRGVARTFRGRMTDRRYDLPVRALESLDQVLRVRTFQSTGSDAAPAEVTWKGPTRQSETYKEREELQFQIGDPAAAHEVLSRLGYVIIEAIDRCVEFYRLGGAVLRIEWYPRMDVLVEVEGVPAEIELAIEATGLSRSDFTPDRLLDFATRYQQRTGERVALSLAALGEGGVPGWPRWAQR